MKLEFYKEWFENRHNKVLEILGKEWFEGKEILELGACHGDFGIEFQKLGSNVVFSDARVEHLNSITPNLYKPAELVCLNQNEYYDLKRKFDMVLHFGVLYHIENWKQDLECALKHTNMMLLETVVNPENGMDDFWTSGSDYIYDEFNCLHPNFTEKSVEKVLTDLGASFKRFDHKNLNTYGKLHDKVILQNVYDWTDKNYKKYFSESTDGIELRTHYRRFWLIVKS